jgi:hypothetical protein
MIPHAKGYFPCPFVEGQDCFQPCVEVEGGKDELGQKVVGGPIVAPNNNEFHPF